MPWLRLAALILSEVGYYWLLLPRMQRCREGIPFLVICAQTLILFFAGMVECLAPAALILWAGGVAGLIYRLIPRFRAPFQVPVSLWALAGLTVYGCLLTKGKVFTFCDNFYHWASICKVMITTDAYPLADSIVTFTSYPPGTACWIYYVCRVVTGQSVCEWGMMMAQAVLISSAVVPLLALGRARLQKLAAVLGFGLIMLDLLTGAVPWTDLMPDAVLPAITIGMMALTVLLLQRSSSGKTPAPWILLPPLMLLMLVKNSGIFFALWGMAVWFALARPKGKEAWLHLLLMVLCMGVWLLWRYYISARIPGAMKSKHSLGRDAILNNFAMTTGEHILDIAHLYWNAVKQQLALHCTALLPLALLIPLRRRLKGGAKALPWLSAGFWLLWHVGLLAVYTVFMHFSEGLALGGFSRYELSLRPALTAMLTLTLVMTDTEGFAPIFRALSAAALCVGCAALVLLMKPEYSRLIPGPQQGAERRARMEALCAQCETGPDKSYIVVARDPDKTAGDDPMAKYLLNTRNVLLADSFLDGPGWLTPEWYEEYATTCDYILFMEERPEATDWVAAHLPEAVGQEVVRVK